MRRRLKLPPCGRVQCCAARARHGDVVCVAHVTNTMATDGDDLEKGHDNGTERNLRLVAAIANRCTPLNDRTEDDERSTSRASTS